MVTIGWGWGQNSDQIRECSSVSVYCILSVSVFISNLQSDRIQKSLQTVQRRTQFSIHICVLVSNSYQSLYIFLYDDIYIYLFIYLRTTCCLLCAFAQVHAEIEIDLPLLRPARYRIHQLYKLRSNKVP